MGAGINCKWVWGSFLQTGLCLSIQSSYSDLMLPFMLWLHPRFFLPIRLFTPETTNFLQAANVGGPHIPLGVGIGGAANLVGIQENPGSWTYTSSWIITISQGSLEKSGCLRATLITNMASPWLRRLLDLLPGPFGMAVNISMKPQVFGCKEEIIWRSFLESLSQSGLDHS